MSSSALETLSPEERRLLLALSVTDKRTEYVFMGQRGPLTISGIYRVIHKCMQCAQIAGPKMGPHRLRHAFGKNYIGRGGDSRSLQKIMGHANISTTEIYVELSKDEVRSKHHRFTPLRGVYIAAQENLFEQDAVKEAEKILEERRE